MNNNEDNIEEKKENDQKEKIENQIENNNEQIDESSNEELNDNKETSIDYESIKNDEKDELNDDESNKINSKTDSSLDEEDEEKKKLEEARLMKEREELYKVFEDDIKSNSDIKSMSENKKGISKAEGKRFDKWCFAGLITGLLLSVLFNKAFNVRLWVTPFENIKSTTNKINEINFFIDKYALYEKKPDKIEEMILRGMMAGLDDRYSRYYSEKDIESLTQTTTGEYVGIGVVVLDDKTQNTVIVTEVYGNSPAKEAGLEVGDKLIKVDGKPIEGLDIDEIVKTVKGKAGTKVDITVLKQDGREITLTIVRQKVEMTETEGKMLDDKVAYIKLNKFEGKAYEQFIEYKNEFQKNNAKGLIIDLRNNTGGNLNVLQNLSDIFLDKKLITYFKYKDGHKDEYFTKEGKWDIPVVILVNEYSASASEAFSGALQDYKVATLVGKKTFGKGVVQDIHELSDKTAIKFTVAKYYTPKGRNFDGEGIVPDVEIDVIRDKDGLEVVGAEDVQLNKARQVMEEKIK